MAMIHLLPLYLVLMEKTAILRTNKVWKFYHNKDQSTKCLPLFMELVKLLQMLRKAKWFAGIGSRRVGAAMSRSANSRTLKASEALVEKASRAIPMFHRCLSAQREKEEGRIKHL
jgi:hypothetical protein